MTVQNVHQISGLISRYQIPKGLVCFVATSMAGFTVYAPDLSAFLARRPIAQRRTDALEKSVSAIVDLIESSSVTPNLRDFEQIAELIAQRHSTCGYDAALDRFTPEAV